MKHKFSCLGAFRARTHALIGTVMLTILYVLPSYAQTYSYTNDANTAFLGSQSTELNSGYGPYNESVTITREMSMDNAPTSYCYKVIISGGTGKKARLYIYCASPDGITYGGYTVADTRAANTILKSDGILEGYTPSGDELNTTNIHGSYIYCVNTKNSTTRYWCIYSGQMYIQMEGERLYISNDRYNNQQLSNSRGMAIRLGDSGLRLHTEVTGEIEPSEAATAGCTISGTGTYEWSIEPSRTTADLTASGIGVWEFYYWDNRTTYTETTRTFEVSQTTVSNHHTAHFYRTDMTSTITIAQAAGQESLSTIYIETEGTYSKSDYVGKYVSATTSITNSDYRACKWISNTLKETASSSPSIKVDVMDETWTLYVRLKTGVTNRTITINSDGHGTGSCSSSNYDGIPSILTATPDDGYEFDYWELNGSNVSTTNPYKFTVSGNATYTAHFKVASSTPTYDVAATVSPAGAGLVSGYGSFAYGTDVTLTAYPTNRRYVFSHWTDEDSSAGTDGVDTYTIDDIAANHNNVVAVFTEVPVTLADNEETSYYTATASTFTGSMDFQLMRTFYAGMWNTVCFPFDLTASQITASDMSGATFYTLSSVTGDAAEGLDFNVSKVTSLSARTPYLVQVSGANIVNPVFEGVTLAASAFTNNTSGTNVGDTRFFGTVHPTALETGENSGFLFLGQNNQLYWPNVANDIRAFRAYFYSGNNTVQAVHPRVRLVVRPETPTDVIEGYNADTWSAVVPARKVLDNGNLIIERDGIRYNAVGQIIR